MKKVLVLFSLFAIVALAGCQQAATSPTTVPSGTAVAESIGTSVYYSTYVDAVASGGMGISSADTGILAATDLVYTDGWWNFSIDSVGISYTFKARAYTSTGAEITDESELSANTNKLEIVVTFSYGSSLSMNFGTESAPLTFDGLKSDTKSINGSINVEVTDSDGKEYSVSLTYVGVELDGSGFPLSGSSEFSFSSSDYATVAGTVTYGGATATLVFSEPADLVGVTYTIDLNAGGTVTTSSL